MVEKLQFLPQELAPVCAGIHRVLYASRVMSFSLTLSTSTKMEKFTAADTTLNFLSLDVQPVMRSFLLMSAQKLRVATGT